jgi:hypothetical protein
MREKRGAELSQVYRAETFRSIFGFWFQTAIRRWALSQNLDDICFEPLGLAINRGRVRALKQLIFRAGIRGMNRKSRLGKWIRLRRCRTVAQRPTRLGRRIPFAVHMASVFAGGHATTGAERYSNREPFSESSRTIFSSGATQFNSETD